MRLKEKSLKNTNYRQKTTEILSASQTRDLDSEMSTIYREDISLKTSISLFLLFLSFFNFKF